MRAELERIVDHRQGANGAQCGDESVELGATPKECGEPGAVTPSANRQSFKQRCDLSTLVAGEAAPAESLGKPIVVGSVVSEEVFDDAVEAPTVFFLVYDDSSQCFTDFRLRGETDFADS